MAYQQRNGSSYQSPRIQLSEEQQATLIEDRIAQHSTRVQGVEALSVFAFVYPKEPKTTMNGNVYADVDFQVPVENLDGGEQRQSEYISARLWGDEVQAIHQCREYFVNERGKPRLVLISYTPSKLTTSIGINKAGQPQAYLKADRVVIFLDITSTIVVGNRTEAQQTEEEQQQEVVPTASTMATELDDMPF